MYKSKKILALIPARGGSKGIPHKNIVNLKDKPLIDYTILAAKNSQYIDYILVSTDDKEIAEVAQRSGAEVPFMRPQELASDTAKTIDVVLHAIDYMKRVEMQHDILVLLQPTQPLRTAEDIDGAIETFFEHNCKALVSVSPAETHPILIRSIADGKLIPMLKRSSTCRRQDFPAFYQVNGCIYINCINEIDGDTSFNDNEIPFVMESSHSVDIDEPSDLFVAEYYLGNNGIKYDGNSAGKRK